MHVFFLSPADYVQVELHKVTEDDPSSCPPVFGKKVICSTNGEEDKKRQETKKKSGAIAYIMVKAFFHNK